MIPGAMFVWKRQGSLFGGYSGLFKGPGGEAGTGFWKIFKNESNFFFIYYGLFTGVDKRCKIIRLS